MLRYLITALLLSVCSAWIPIQRGMELQTSRSALFMNPDGESNPCWQDIYDADCTMDSVFSARFVASDWIKELPCGSGMKDCDFPEDVLLPDMRPESHTEINVMEFLNIKRADESKKLSP
mmetsp:Transcript_20682/g.42563  ORF Transcript_20682/g.42563 Transcript_20682/m.42563 type:complete len:120 (-) Transcript_20682:306-665(-)